MPVSQIEPRTSEVAPVGQKPFHCFSELINQGGSAKCYRQLIEKNPFLSSRRVFAENVGFTHRNFSISLAGSPVLRKLPVERPQLSSIALREFLLIKSLSDID